MPVSVPPPEAIKEFFGATTRHIRRVEIYEEDGTTRWVKDTVPRLKSGSVSVDYSRDERRSFDLTLSNDDEVLINAPGEFWYDKIIKVFRGVQVNGTRRQPKILIASDLTGDLVQGPSVRAALLDLGFGDIQINPLANDYLFDIDPYDVIIALGNEDKGLLLERAYDAGKSVIVFRKAAEHFLNALHNGTTWASTMASRGNRIERRRNLFKNPRVAANLTGWSGWAGTAGVVTTARVATGGPNNESFIRLTWTTASTAQGGTTMANAAGQRVPVTPGEKVAAAVWVRSNISKPMALRLEFRNPADSAAAGTVVGPTIQAAANAWTRLFVTAMVPEGAGHFSVAAYNTTGGWAVNNTLDATQMLIEKADFITDFFDGASTDTASGDRQWVGTANDSFSIIVSDHRRTRSNLVTNPAVLVDTTGWTIGAATGGNGTVTRVATGGPSGGTSFARFTLTTAPTSGPGSSIRADGRTVARPIHVKPGEQYTASIHGRASWASTRLQAQLWFFDGTGTVINSAVLGAVATPAVNTWVRLSVTATAPTNAVYAMIGCYTASGTPVPPVNATLDATMAMLEVGSDLGGYFDGSTVDTAEVKYEWGNVASSSASHMVVFEPGTLTVTPRRVNDPRTIGYPSFEAIATNESFKVPANTLAGLFSIAPLPVTTGDPTHSVVSSGSNPIGGKYVAVHIPVTAHQYSVPGFRQFLLAQMNWLNPVEALTRWEVQVGEFMIDRISEPHFPHEMKITGRDYTKKCMLSKYTEATQYAAGAALESIIDSIAVGAGVAKRLMPKTGVVVAREFFFERGTSRWEAMKEIATAYNHELFFDATGYLVLRPFRDPSTTAPVVYIQTGKTGQVASYEKSTSDSSLFNHVLVIGESSDTAIPPVWAEAKNTDPNSPTSIQQIGDRYVEFTSALVTTKAQAQELADSFLAVSQLEEFELSFETLIMPWLEAGDILGWDDPNPAPDDPNTFLLSGFEIPLDLGPMGGTGRRVTRVV